MASRQSAPRAFTGLRGRDGSTSSVGVPPEQGGIPWDKCLEALNIEWDGASFGRKRPGSSALPLTFGSGGPFANGIFSLGVSGTVSTPVLWAADGNQIAFKSVANTWTEPSITVAPNAATMQFLSFDGRTYIAYLNASARLGVYDGTSIRLAGMATPAAPTVANTGAGAYAAVLRYYRVRYVVQSGGVTLRQGEASAAQSFTPSGGGTAARVTKPAATSPAEGETHWQLEVSLDNAVWYVLALTAVGTTTYDDSAATTTYAQNDAAPLAGAFTNWGSVRILSADDTRLIGAVGSTLYWSPVKGTTSASFLDCERVPNTVEQKNQMSIIGDGDDGDITAISLPFQGAFWVFKQSAMHRLIPTGIDTAAYRRVQVCAGSGIGCLNQKTIVYGLDEFGQPAMYWLSARGPYRQSNAGLQWLGEDIADVWDSLATGSNGVNGLAHGCADPDRRQILWWVPRSSTNDTRLMLDTRLARVSRGGLVRDGWAVHTGLAAKARCSVTGSSLHVNSGNNPDQHRPFFGLNVAEGTSILYRNNALTDDGTAFQAYVDLPDRHYGGLDHQCTVTGLAAIGSAGSHTLRATVTRNYGEQARSDDESFAAGGSETRKLVVFEGIETADADSVAVRIGDALESAAAWSLDALLLSVEQRESRVP